jgi:hypothetical protein
MDVQPVSGDKSGSGTPFFCAPNTYLIMEQQPENTTLLRLQSTEANYIKEIFARIDDFSQYNEAWLGHECLEGTEQDIDRIVSFLAGLLDEYRKLKILREIIEEINQKVGTC